MGYLHSADLARNRILRAGPADIWISDLASTHRASIAGVGEAGIAGANTGVVDSV